MTTWAPSVTPNDVIRHSQGPWEDHKYVKVVDGKYYYPDGYTEGRTVSDLKGSSDSKKSDSNKATKSDYSKDDSDFDDKNYSSKNAIGNTEFYGFKGKDGRNVIVMEDKKWSLPEGTEIDSKLKKRLEKVSEEIEERRKNGEKISADEWNKLVDDAINGTSSKKTSSSSKKTSSSKSSSKTVKEKDSVARAYGKSIVKSMKEKQKAKEKERRRRQNVIDRKAYLNHTDLIWQPSITASDIICHHGIEGQRWGKRNGPPYPLTAGAHSPEEKRAKYQRSINRNEKRALRLRKRAAKLNIKANRKATRAIKRGNVKKFMRSEKIKLKASKLELKASRKEEYANKLRTKLNNLDAATMSKGANIYEGLKKKMTREEKKAYKQRMKNLKKAREVREKNKKEAAKKEEILRKGSAKDIAKIKDKLTSDDYKRVFDRLDNENKLEQRINQNVKTGKERYNDIVSMLSTTANAAQNAVNLYNNVAKTYNTFNKKSKKLPVIGEKDDSFQKMLINKANVDTLVKNRNKLNGDELAKALARLKTEDSLDKYYKDKLEERIKK